LIIPRRPPGILELPPIEDDITDNRSVMNGSLGSTGPALLYSSMSLHACAAGWFLENQGLPLSAYVPNNPPRRSRIPGWD